MSDSRSHSDDSIGLRASEERDWRAAVAALEEADNRSPLKATDLERYARVTQLIGDDRRSAALWERAHHAHQTNADPPGAARAAFWLAFGLMERGEMAQAGGWLARAERVLDVAGSDCAERGYLAIPEALGLLEGHQAEAARARFESIAAVGERFADHDLVAIGRLGEGQSLIRLGNTRQGARLLDEVMVSVTADEVSPAVAGIVYCAVIEACQEMFDLARAQEWTDALHRWCESQPDLIPFRGRCLVYRAEIMQLRGAWADAVVEAQRAHDRLADPPQPAVGAAAYRQGELHRLRGALAEADDAYRRAAERGYAPQPGQALLRHAQGRPDAALTAIRHALDESTAAVTRAPLLAAAVELASYRNDHDLATEAARELNTIANVLDAPLLTATAERALGIAALLAGSAAEASTYLGRALALWLSLPAPYEAARTRVLLARVADIEGDASLASAERSAARETFDSLGAITDLNALDAESDHSTAAGGLTPRERKVLSLVATGMTNRAIADHLSISDKTVARHLSNIFRKLDISSRAAATAYAYEHDLL